MPVEKILVEYAKLHLQLVQAQQVIAQLQAELTAAQTAPTPPPPQPASA